MMKNRQTIKAISRILASQPYKADFVYPSLACMLAASGVSFGRDPMVELTDRSRTYAEHSGLLNALAGRYDAMVRPRN